MARGSRKNHPQARCHLLFSSAILLDSPRISAAAISIASGSQDSKPLKKLLFQALIFMQVSQDQKNVIPRHFQPSSERPHSSNWASEGTDWLLSRNTRGLPDRSLPSLPKWWEKAPLKLRQASEPLPVFPHALRKTQLNSQDTEAFGVSPATYFVQRLIHFM
ncbi:hypothetical protein BDP81DRAFT_417565 [Colletotrichum phormii]|uniref:Uncharacterized protein n=1 Tax=Colletotrichum phormii TaxID=359342 RepID=A0AAJ0ELF9_9PEZI|nr:uncharacterized protein BDP81DRAFT_417565 [Colletotrichum phormii]KAK1640870.1 hypothetical protein BDP81DRAFT_417565 [Colletotrichum phormii]